MGSRRPTWWCTIHDALYDQRRNSQYYNWSQLHDRQIRRTTQGWLGWHLFDANFRRFPKNINCSSVSVRSPVLNRRSPMVAVFRQLRFLSIFCHCRFTCRPDNILCDQSFSSILSPPKYYWAQLHLFLWQQQQLKWATGFRVVSRVWSPEGRWGTKGESADLQKGDDC
jgi:hypothetical protein